MKELLWRDRNWIKRFTVPLFVWRFSRCFKLCGVCFLALENHRRYICRISCCYDCCGHDGRDKKGSKEAAKTANGSVYGMIGCFICVIAVLLMLKWTDLWLVSLIIGLVVWFFSSVFLVHLRENGVRK